MAKSASAGRVRAIGRGGEAVVETAEGVVFVAGGLPGERIELVPLKAKGGAKRARLDRVVEGSESRREPSCNAVSRCGGCPLMIADATLQRAIKEGFLRDACKGLPGADETELSWIGAPSEFGYRRRARFAWDRGILGYREPQSDRVVDIDQCIVLVESLQRALGEVRATLGSRIRGRGELQLMLSGERVVVDVRAMTEQPPELFAACARLTEASCIAGVALTTGLGEAPATWGDTRVVLRAADGDDMWAPPGGFTQANDAINQSLVQQVVAFADPEEMRVLELHCGVGNFTIELARQAKTLVAVERDPSAVRACRDNLASRGLNARIVEGDANRPPKGQYDVVVLDPPRQGARDLFEHHDSWKRAKRIVYVSCDTATLQRDLRIACANGHRIDRLAAFDMFPQTAHVEALVRLVR